MSARTVYASNLYVETYTRMVLPLAADKVVFKGKPEKGGADESTAAASAGGVCV